MRPEELWRHYPVVYHIAWGGSSPSIQEHGLLSTKALLRLYGKTDEAIAALTQARRAHWVEIDCPGRPSAVLRDQKPMTDAGLRRALDGSAEPWQWYDLINSMVFFWPTTARLGTMLTASAYEGVAHGRAGCGREGAGGDWSATTSGSRRSTAGARDACLGRGDVTLFKRFADYPFEYRRRKYGVARAVAEVCVVDRVERIAEAVLDVKRGTAGEVMKALADG